MKYPKCKYLTPELCKDLEQSLYGGNNVFEDIKYHLFNLEFKLSKDQEEKLTKLLQANWDSFSQQRDKIENKYLNDSKFDPEDCPDLDNDESSLVYDFCLAINSTIEDFLRDNDLIDYSN